MSENYTLICNNCGCDLLQVPKTFTSAFAKSCGMKIKAMCSKCDKETLHDFKKEA